MTPGLAHNTHVRIPGLLFDFLLNIERSRKTRGKKTTKRGNQHETQLVNLENTINQILWKFKKDCHDIWMSIYCCCCCLILIIIVLNVIDLLYST